jgi:hypothetical protein
MKKPRNLLFARHQAVVPKLDAIRQSVVAAVCDRLSEEPLPNARQSQITNTTTVLQAFWRELVFPCRRVWTGLAAVWVLLFIVNFSQRDRMQTAAAANSAPMTMMSFRDQQKLLNELFADRSLPVEAERPRIFSPKPRTEKSEVRCV